MNKKNTRQKENKGITLIALVITIIVMLILVAVTISMAVNGGLFDQAGKAAGQTKNALSNEQKLAEGGIEVNEEWYSSIDEYITKDQPKPISKDTPYIGYYVDVDGDGEVDGWTYADAISSVEDKTSLKNYTMSAEKVSGPIGAAEILTAQGSGEQRFSVIADEDFTVNSCSEFGFVGSHSYSWLPSYEESAREENREMTYRYGSGSGRESSDLLLSSFLDAGLNPDDYSDLIWAYMEEDSVWYIPTAQDWRAFLEEFPIVEEIYDPEHYTSYYNTLVEGFEGKYLTATWDISWMSGLSLYGFDISLYSQSQETLLYYESLAKVRFFGQF